MDKFCFLGLSGVEWSLINSFANWIAAIGTVSAVIVSLYLALRSTRPKAKLSIGIRQIVANGSNEHYPEVIAIRLVNVGERLIHVTNIGWKVGKYKKRFAVQVVNPTPYSQSIPISLEYGNEAQWHIPADTQGGWYEYFARGFLKGMGSWKMRTLRIVAYTSTGHEFSAKPEKQLLEALANANQQQESS